MVFWGVSVWVGDRVDGCLEGGGISVRVDGRVG